MIENNKEVKKQVFVGGDYLYGEEQLNSINKDSKNLNEEKPINEKIAQFSLQKEMQEKKTQVKKKSYQKQQRQFLIAMRDTPVQPVPQFVYENQKCQRATQEQFEYFQSFISQKQKEKKFQKEQQEKINKFLKKQEQLREIKIDEPVISIVMHKDEEQIKRPKKKGIKITIKKKNEIKQQTPDYSLEQLQKTRKIRKVQ